MNTITAKTKHHSIDHNSEVIKEMYICDIFNMTRGTSEKDIVDKLPMVWTYDENVKKPGVWFIALMFFMRNIRKDVHHIINMAAECKDFGSIVSKSKGEKLLSYYMVLWLLKKDEPLFYENYTRFVKDIGYYKDCLILAKMAKERNYTDEQIRLILMPMAIELMNDENKIIQFHLKRDGKKPLLSLVSKWAPREGKAFSEFIPYLKQLCNITGPKSNAKWRKYIQLMAKYNNESKPIETLLSTKAYNMINLQKVPVKAFNLYKNTFMRIPELQQKYKKFINRENKIQTSVYKFNYRYCTPLQIIKQFIPLVLIPNS